MKTVHAGDGVTTYVYERSDLVPWPEAAKRQLEEAQATLAAQTAEINRLIDRIEHLERLVHRYINGGGDD